MKSKLLRLEGICLGLALLLATPLAVGTEGFAVLVAPPRFELKANPGDSINEHIEITNPGDRPVSFLIRTADWEMTEQGTATFYPPELKPGSCRPWVRIERHKIRLPAQGKKRYRFQLRIPEDTPPGECRVALLIEVPPEDAVQAQVNSINLPIRGRIAIVIYLAIGGAQPELVVKSMQLTEHNGQLTPVITVENKGIAHGRTSGYVDAIDANGKRIDFEITPLPILSGQSRKVPLYQPSIDEREPENFVAPLELTGKLEWETGTAAIRHRLEKSPE